MNLIEITNKFPTELDAVKHFEKVRWRKKPKCSYCGSDNIGSRNKDGRFHCKNCNKTFSVTTNTNIHNTRLPLKTWLFAFGVISDAKMGISAKQLERNLGIHYETAWVMYHKIRGLMSIENEGGRGREKWNPKHDIIFLYTKSDKWIFNFMDVLEDHTLISSSAKQRVKYAGALVHHRQGKGSGIPKNKVLPSDTWYIATINAMAKERLGYPTQKPEALLERIIKASSNEGDIILDAYCGCGTTIAIAERLERNWIGIDITYQSISLILKRLEDSFGKNVLNDIGINGIPEDFESAVALAHKKDDKTRKEFEKWAVLTYSNNRAMINEKKGADAGIDGIAFMKDKDKNSDIELKQVLFSVKSDKNPHVSYIRDFYGTIEREKAAIGYFITLFPPTKNMIAECKKIGKYKNSLMEQEYPKIEIVTVDEILNNKRITVPTSHEVAIIKSAQLKKTSKGQIKLNM